MIRNNIEVDVKVKCIENETTPDGVVNNTFIKMMEALGYDIELTYVKREG